MYGESAFTMQRAVFQSDVEAKRKASGKLIDFSDLEKRAKDYAQVGGGACRRDPGWAAAAGLQGWCQLQTPLQLPVGLPLPGDLLCTLLSGCCKSRRAGGQPAAAAWDDLARWCCMQMREEQGGPPPQQAPPQGSRRQQHPAAAGGPPAAAAAAPPPADPAALEAAERKRAAEEGLPPGWSVAFDAQKKPYFWHKQTKKVQWDKPTADTPIN